MNLRLKCPWNKVGNTKLLKINKNLYAKFELENPTGSIKDRPVQYIVGCAIKNGEIDKNTVLVEASSGNTGISLSAIGASLGLEVKIVMPSNMSKERRQMMELFGAKIIEAPPSDFKAAINIRNKLIKKNKNHWSPMQFENILNVQSHYLSTGKEIIKQIPVAENIDAFFSGAGTGGTIMGVMKSFKEANVTAKCMLVVPADPIDQHGIQGIGDGEDFLVNRARLGGVIPVKTDDAVSRAKRFAKERGVLIGISSGANLFAAEEYIKNRETEGPVVTILCDRGERYLSLY